MAPGSLKMIRRKDHDIKIEHELGLVQFIHDSILSKTMKSSAAFLVTILALAYGQETCKDFIVDQCITSNNSTDMVLEVLHKTGVEDCQMFCNLIYAGSCKFFIYDSKQDLCELWKVPMEDYQQTCTKVGGPVQPTIDNCKAQAQQDPCLVSLFTLKALQLFLH